MPVVINIGNIKINNVATNGSVNIGEVVHNSHSANVKSQGSNTSVGDFSPTNSQMNNGAVDNDVFDQDQIATPSAPIANQI